MVPEPAGPGWAAAGPPAVVVVEQEDPSTASTPSTAVAPNAPTLTLRIFAMLGRHRSGP